MVSRLARTVNLAHRPFVDYYYATRSWCKLYLYLSDSGSVLGTLGRDLTRFEYKSREITIRLASNWYSLEKGVGGQLAKFSIQTNSNSIGLMFTGSRDARRILHHYGYLFMPGVRGYVLNSPYRPNPRDDWLRGAAKSIARRLAQENPIPSFASRISPDVVARISVREEQSYSQDLLPRRSAFTFRFAPTIEYLSWRYNLSLSFVRYRLFRVVDRGTNIGYVIINESPEQLIVAQCDGEDATALAHGVLLSVLEVGRHDQKGRAVRLTSCHPEMREVFERFGFRPQWGGDLPFAFGTRPPEFDPFSDTSSWLINLDWADNGLQPPFLDEAVEKPAGRPT